MAAKAERSLPWKCLSALGTSSIMKRRELAVDEGGAIRALIVDDERLARRRVREMLQSDRDIEVVGEPANGPDAVMAVRESNPDLMFLDVQMPGMDGFEVLNALRDERIPMIVFITAYDQYALRAFEACAVDYILKPFDRARFDRALQQAKSRIRQERQTDLTSHLLTLIENLKQRPQYPERLAIKEGGRIVYVKTDSIEWVEAEGNYVRIHAGKGSYQLLGAISALEAQLDPKKFRRIHRGTIVNIDCIRELQPWFNGCYRVILHNGVELSLSRGYRGKQSDLL
jgi:two-component system LytT family response regulator